MPKPAPLAKDLRSLVASADVTGMVSVPSSRIIEIADGIDDEHARRLESARDGAVRQAGAYFCQVASAFKKGVMFAPKVSVEAERDRGFWRCPSCKAVLKGWPNYCSDCGAMIDYPDSDSEAVNS